MSKWVTRMTLEDAEHYTPEQRAAIISSYPEHERDARTKGVPQLGSGLVFPLADELITTDPISIPRHWARINGLDFGWDHPFAAVSVAHDRDNDCLYVTNAHRESRSTPIIHAVAIKAWGSWIPCAWPHDGLQHDKGSGEALAAQYRTQGLNMLTNRATFEDGGSGVEAEAPQPHSKCLTWINPRRHRMCLSLPQCGRGRPWGAAAAIIGWKLGNSFCRDFNALERCRDFPPYRGIYLG
jgi:hypothetical protein